MAPELSKQSSTKRFRTSEASDVFSLAMTFFYASSGQSPFPHKRDWEVTQLFEAGERPKRSRLVVDLPPAAERILWNLIEDMWAQEKAERPSSDKVVKVLGTIFPTEPAKNGKIGHEADSLTANRSSPGD